MPTPLELELGEQLKVCMRAGDKVGLAAVRMVRTKIMERRTAKNAPEVTDELVVETIRAYVKMLQGGIDELTAAGAGDNEQVIQAKGEIVYLDRFLPKLMDEAQTQALVDRIVAEQGLTDPKMAGKATGLIMKDYKGQVDPGVVSRLVRAKLGA